MTPLDPRAAAAHAIATLEHHRDGVRRALPYVVPLLARVAGFHGKRNGKLAELCDAGQALADRLEVHLEEEEQRLFPALLAGGPRPDAARGELDHLRCYHRETRLLLDRIRSLADGYSAPDWSDGCYRTLMEELEALEEEVTEHMHLERYVLAPRLAVS
jgi:regulator of cell morphogenesis and NO signaling